MPINGWTSPLEPMGVSRKCATGLGNVRRDGSVSRFIAIPRHRAIESRGESGEVGRRSVPSQLLDVLEQRDVRTKCGKGTKQERVIPSFNEDSRKRRRVERVDLPVPRVLRDGFEVEELREPGR